MAVRDGDTALWLHNKLGSTDDLWSGSSICSQLSREKLISIHDCFHTLQPYVKVKLMLSFLHLPKRNVEEWQHDLMEILNLAQEDTDQWVAMIGDILKTFPMSGTLNKDVDDSGRFYHDIQEALKKLLKKPDKSSMLPMECLYLSKPSMLSTAGQQPTPIKHFALKLKPKSAALRAELLKKSVEASAGTRKNSSASTIPIKVRSFAKTFSDNDNTPMKGLPSRPEDARKYGRNSQQTPFAGKTNQNQRREGGIKFLDITEQPIGGREAKRRRRIADQEAMDQQKKEKELQSATPDYAAGLTSTLGDNTANIEGGSTATNDHGGFLANAPSDGSGTLLGLSPMSSAAATTVTATISNDTPNATSGVVTVKTNVPQIQVFQTKTAVVSVAPAATVTTHTLNTGGAASSSGSALIHTLTAAPGPSSRATTTLPVTLGATAKLIAKANPAANIQVVSTTLNQAVRPQQAKQQTTQQPVLLTSGTLQQQLRQQQALLHSVQPASAHLVQQPQQANLVQSQLAQQQPAIKQQVQIVQPNGQIKTIPASLIQQQLVRRQQPQRLPQQQQLLQLQQQQQQQQPQTSTQLTQQLLQTQIRGSGGAQTVQIVQQQQPQQQQQPSAVITPGATSVQQQPQILQSQQQQQPAKRQQLQLTNEQLRKAKELFQASPMLTRPEKAMILGFMAGIRDNPCPSQGPIANIRLSEQNDTIRQPDGTFTPMIVDTFFQMDFESGQWQQIKKYRPREDV